MNQEYDVIVVRAGPMYIYRTGTWQRGRIQAFFWWIWERTIDHRNCPARTLNRCVGCRFVQHREAAGRAQALFPMVSCRFQKR